MSSLVPQSAAATATATATAATAPAAQRPPRPLTRAEYERFDPLVRRIAMKMARRVPSHITVGDLISYGWVGLLEALARTEATMSHEEFEAYASYRVRGAMLDHLRSLDPATRTVRAQSRRVSRVINDLTKKNGRAPEEQEIANALGVSVEDYGVMLESIALAGMARLELLNFDNLDLAAHGEGPEDSASRMLLSEAVMKAIGQLPERLQKVLALYYQDECTLREIGEVLGVTESRACQLHTEAMHRLRASVGRE